MRNTNQPEVAAHAAAALLALSGTRATSAELRAILDGIKVTAGCADCGYAADPRALDFAHVDEATKYRTRSGRVEQPSDLGKAGRDGFPRYSQAVVLAEAAKCDVLCATCHRLRTFEDRETPRVSLCSVCGEEGPDVVALMCDDCAREDEREATRARFDREMSAGIARLQEAGINWD